MHLDWIKDRTPAPLLPEPWPGQQPAVGFPRSLDGYCIFIWASMGPNQPILQLELPLVPLLPPHKDQG
jgi:hypothetical protein